jgi:hypothetical protein
VARGLHLDLTAEQQSQIIIASHAVSNPETFTRTVRERLAREPEIGEGVIFRACREAQRELFRPPPDITEKATHRPQPLRKIR